MLKKLLQGMVVGIANIIPGVSGGTMMVAMGLYDKLIHAITHLKSEFKESLKLLVPIFLGAAIAIVALSRLFEFLLTNYPIPTNFAFCGLIAGSLPFIFKKVKGHAVSVGTINRFMDVLIAFDIQDILVQCGILIPFGIGVILGIFLIAKLIEFIFSKAEIHAYYAILGLILASPIAILLKTDWSDFSVLMLVTGIITFVLGWFVSSKLGGE